MIIRSFGPVMRLLAFQLEKIMHQVPFDPKLDLLKFLREPKVFIDECRQSLACLRKWSGSGRNQCIG